MQCDEFCMIINFTGQTGELAISSLVFIIVVVVIFRLWLNLTDKLRIMQFVANDLVCCQRCRTWNMLNKIITLICKMNRFHFDSNAKKIDDKKNRSVDKIYQKIYYMGWHDNKSILNQSRPIPAINSTVNQFLDVFMLIRLQNFKCSHIKSIIVCACVNEYMSSNARTI